MSSGLKNRVQRFPDFARNDNDKSERPVVAYGLSAHDGMKISCVIRTAHEWPRGDVEKTFSTCDATVVIELLRSDVFDNGQMAGTRPEILANRQDLAADLAQIIHGLKQFGFLFAKAEHYPALCHNLRRQFLCTPQGLQGYPILSARTHHGREPFDRFHIVIVDVGMSVENCLNAPIICVKIRNEHFDDD